MTHDTNTDNKLFGDPGIAFVLLSGGIDSTTCLHIAAEQFPVVVGVSIDYGQRHFKELGFAKAQCDGLGVPHRVLDLSRVIPKTVLTNKAAQIPDADYADIQGVSPVYVPFRNGLMLAAITSALVGELEEQGRDDVGESAVYFGAHSEDAQRWAYADCTPEFIGAMANAIYVGTYHKVRLHTPLQWMTKQEIIKWGSFLGVDWEATWSCYKGGDLHCGTCPTCRSRRQGFMDAKIADPTQYETNPMETA